MTTGEPDSITSSISGWRIWLPAVLLVVVAIMQITLAMTADLSPWKGGGFGMFSTIDGTAFRGVRIIVEAPDRSEELDVAPSQQVLAAQVRLFPSEYHFRNLARSVVAREARYGRPVTVVRLEVFRAEFNEYLEATDKPFRTFTWDVAQNSDNSR